jgi:ABC-type sulfate/molybdate transport systems ATPase subunit
VFVEHDRDFVRRLADEVMVYRNGTVATTGSPERVL